MTSNKYSEYLVLQMMQMKLGSKDECIEAAIAVNNKSLNDAADWLMNNKNKKSSHSNRNARQAQRQQPRHQHQHQHQQQMDNGANNNNYGNQSNISSSSSSQYSSSKPRANSNNSRTVAVRNSNTNANECASASAFNEVHVLQMVELGLGTREQAIEASKRHNNNFDAAVEFILQQNKSEPTSKSNNAAPYSHLSERNHNNSSNNSHANPYLSQSHSYSNNNNSHASKIRQIRQKYPDLKEYEIRDLLDRHNGNADHTLKFIAIDRERSHARKRAEEEEVRRRKEAAQRRQRQRQQKQKQKPKEEDELADMLGGLLSLAIVEEVGFMLASDHNRIILLKRLSSVQCSGQTALHDAVIIGIDLMLRLKAVLSKIGSLKHQFIHIVLTDGEDTSSKKALSDVQILFLKMGVELGDLCKTFFIGINLGHHSKQKLQRMSALGGESCALYNCDDVGLSDVFDRIKIRIGIEPHIRVTETDTHIVMQRQNVLSMEVQQHKFLVLFTLDKSGSMAGGRWKRVVQAVAGFCVGMKASDIVGCILFNDEATLIT